ncbi:MAG TPA: acetylxylan esterase [Pseudonocardia sp.]
MQASITTLSSRWFKVHSCPYRRGEDISYAVDALTTIPGIDPQRIGILGICAGGGYAVHAARTDHRIKAVGTVVPVNIGTAFRGFQPDGPAAALGLADIDITQAITYYRTERGGNEHSTNRRLSRSDSLLLGYDAFHLVGQLMTQPLQVILAGRVGSTGSHESGMQLWKVAPNPVDLMVIDGAGHYEMYDEPEYVDAAVDRLTDFYVDNL